MSLKVTTDMICDDCGASIRCHEGERSAAVAARREARRHGWRQYRFGRDQCPSCADRAAAEAAASHERMAALIDEATAQAKRETAARDAAKARAKADGRAGR